MNVYNTHDRSFANCDFSFFFSDHWIVHLLQCNQPFQAIEFVDLPLPEKLKSLSFLSFLRKTGVASVTQRFLFPVSTVAARNAWDHRRRFVY